MRKALSLGGLMLLLGFALAQPSPMEPWKHNHRVDPITDVDSSTISTDMWLSNIRATPSAVLVIRCSEPEPMGVEVFIAYTPTAHMRMELPANAEHEAVYRFDSEEPVYGPWLGSTTGTASFLPSNRTGAFIASLLSADLFYYRVTAPDGKEFTFDVPTIRNAHEALEHLGCYKGSLTVDPSIN